MSYVSKDLSVPALSAGAATESMLFNDFVAHINAAYESLVGVRAYRTGESALHIMNPGVAHLWVTYLRTQAEEQADQHADLIRRLRACVESNTTLTPDGIQKIIELSGTA